MKSVRKAARTIILDEDCKKIAILEVKDGHYHKIPGGGIEDGESNETAAIREAYEEGGCEIELIGKIGELEFVDPEDRDVLHYSVCFLAKKIKDHPSSYFTQEEISNKFRLLWLPLEDAVKLFENPSSKDAFELEMNYRDLKFIKMSKNIIENTVKHNPRKT